MFGGLWHRSGPLLLCRFVGFAIIVGLLGDSYSSVLRVRPDVGVPVVLLLPGCCAASIRFWCKSRQNPSCSPFNIGVDHNWLLGHLFSAVCCCADSSGLPSLWGCRAVAVHPCYDSDQASGFRSCCWSWTCCCNDTGTEEAHYFSTFRSTGHGANLNWKVIDAYAYLIRNEIPQQLGEKPMLADPFPVHRE
ncbi:AAEL013638-PA [Aedes aegypti]|uniref:AAEL013638-PA n=1 Tax=Aedes aegypti TaxID=7159 RepID=Q16IJ7_AEDAE|nr:AAEL013638-PA [Aedes aegypti]